MGSPGTVAASSGVTWELLGLDEYSPAAMLAAGDSVTQTDRVLSQFADQARASEELGSPFTAMLCRVLAARLHTGTQFGRRILEWDGDPFPDNVALRACGAIHALARSGWEPALTKIYPPNPTSENAL